MGILQALKALFQHKTFTNAAVTSSEQKPAFDVAAYMVPFNARLAEDFKLAEIESVRFAQYYGDFTPFLYRPEFDSFLRKEVLYFWEPANPNKDFLDHNHWLNIHPYNFPGPFYTGESDTCGTGNVQAPDNVANDAHCCEYIFKQPTSYYEFLCILNAAAVEVLDSYSSNGNDYWTYEACRQWWQSRTVLMRALTRKEVVDKNDGQAQLYLDYLNGEAEIDLRCYCYFLLHGIYPDDQAALPEL